MTFAEENGGNPFFFGVSFLTFHGFGKKWPKRTMYFIVLENLEVVIFMCLGFRQMHLGGTNEIDHRDGAEDLSLKVKTMYTRLYVL